MHPPTSVPGPPFAPDAHATYAAFLLLARAAMVAAASPAGAVPTPASCPAATAAATAAAADGPIRGFFCCIRGIFLRRIGPCLILDAFDAKPRVQPPGTSIMMRMSVLIGHRDMSDRITLRVCIQVTEVMYAPREIICWICRHSAFFDCSLVIYTLLYFRALSSLSAANRWNKVVHPPGLPVGHARAILTATR